MAYIDYGQSTAGGKQLAELMAKTQALAAEYQRMRDWIDAIGPAALVSHDDFGVPDVEFSSNVTMAQALNDTFLQVADDFATFYGDGSGGSNREKISRLARGS